MTILYDFNKEEMKTGLLYGISHKDKNNAWMAPYRGSYSMSDFSRGENKNPTYAFKIWDPKNPNVVGKLVDSDKFYHVQEFVWNSKKKEYVPTNHYLINDKPSIFNDTYYLRSKEFGDANNTTHHNIIGFSNFNQYTYINYRVNTGNADTVRRLPYYAGYTYDLPEEKFIRGPIPGDILDGLTENEKKNAKFFIFESAEKYLHEYVSTVGYEEGIIIFSKRSGVLKVTVKNGDLPINSGSSKRWEIIKDGIYIDFFKENIPVSQIAEHINKQNIQGENFVITNQQEIEVHRHESNIVGKSSLIFYKLMNTLLARVIGDEFAPVSETPSHWYVYVDGKKTFDYFNQDYMGTVKNNINKADYFKGEFFLISTKDSYLNAVSYLVDILFEIGSSYRRLRKDVTKEEINKADTSSLYLDRGITKDMLRKLIEHAHMLFDGDKLIVKEKNNGRTLENSILIGLNHKNKKFVTIDLNSYDKKSIFLYEGNTHYSFTLYKKGTSNIRKSITVKKGEDIQNVIQEINQTYYTYDDILKFYHSDGHKESILDVYTDNVKEPEKFARIRYFIITEKGFQEIFNIKNWETTSYYIDGVTFSQVPQGKKMKYKVVLNGNDIGTAYPDQTNGKGTDTVLFTQDYYDMEGWGVSKHDNHIVVFAIDPDTGLEYEIAHHEPHHTREGDIDISEEYMHHNVQMNFYNSTCNIYMNKKR